MTMPSSSAGLGFIRDHTDSAESYRLAEEDLGFAELLPEKPAWIQQEEYEERTSVGFQLERLTKSVGTFMPNALAGGWHAEEDA